MNDVDVVSPTTDPAPADELLCRTLSISTRRIACCVDTIKRDLTSLANEVGINWGKSGWVSLLEAGHDHDRELHGSWVPRKTEAELWAASLVGDDVATIVTDDLAHSWVPSGRRAGHGNAALSSLRQCPISSKKPGMTTGTTEGATSVGTWENTMEV
jgi:hypothetical protein